jgi:hypothetical protein
VGNFPAEDGVDFFDGVAGFLAALLLLKLSVTIFCVACFVVVVVVRVS